MADVLEEAKFDEAQVLLMEKRYLVMTKISQV